MINNKKIKIILCICILAMLLIIFLWWSNSSIKTNEIYISSEKIPEELHGFTIIQISDLHNKEFGDNQKTLIKEVKNASPDIIAITGDFIDSRHTDLKKSMEFIIAAVKIAPVYYVTGNHESRVSQYKELKEQMLKEGVKVLEDEGTIIKHAGASIRILGINDLQFRTGNNQDERIEETNNILKDIAKESSEFTILLSHRPEIFDVYIENNIDLVLSGHAHGGQIRLPFVGGLLAPNQGIFPKYSEGVYEDKNTKMVVSRGLGNSIFPLRVNNRPELVVIRLQ